MGKTLEDIKRESGLSDKTFIEAHYGMKPKVFYPVTLISIALIIVIALLIGN